MGDIARTGADSDFKMNIATWLLLILGVVTLATPALSSEPRVVCYYTNWSVYRPGTARFNPQNINPYLCTHLIYAFGGFTKDNTLKPFDKYQDIEKGGYAKFTGLKTYNKNLKTMLAIGGWNEASTKFSPMVASRERRKEFVRNAIKFLRQNRFDGLDLDWEYPAFRDGGKPKDRENYARLVKELREEFEREAEKTKKPRLLLTMAVPAGIEYIQKGFDVKTLNTYLDWMNLLTYDYHSAFEPAVNHHAPLYPIEEPNEYSVDTELNIDYTIKFYLENGADRDKLVLGIPTYGRSYTLFNADAVEIGSPADGPGEQGDATREKGYLAYYEICEALKPKDKVKKRSASDEDSEEYEEEEEEEWTIIHPNPDAMGPVAYKGNQWVGYDDIDIVKKKAEYVVDNGLGGIMFWSIDNDDFRGNCHSKPYPLIEAAKEAYIAKLGSGTIISVTEKPKAAGRPGSRRRNKPKASSTTAKPSANKRKNSITSTTPSWKNTPEPPTTPDPGSDFKCVDEGFFPHPRDCKKYFWCLDSGPSNLGIVAHQFTCPSGLFFNKAADSCDFARNVLCKIQDTTKATTKAPKPTTTVSTTTRKPVRLSTKSSVLFRTTTTTTAVPEPESVEYEEEVVEDNFDEDAEDPKVIKELIDLIKKVGGVEQLEKQLHRSETSSTEGGSSTTPSPFNKILYQKVLERARGTNKYTGNNISLNSRRGPQSAGLETQRDAPEVQTVSKDRPLDKDRPLNKDRPQYTTINRSRPPISEPDNEVESPPRSRARAAEPEGSTARSLQYVNIRRARPTVTSDTADDTASRNALFERSEAFVSVSEPSLDISSSRRDNQPEYVTIRRQRPTTEEATTIQYEEADSEVDIQETALEREISSQPQYTSIVRARSTNSPPEEPLTEATPAPTRPTTPEESSPEPTTVLAVQISSLLNSPNSAEETSAPETTAAPTTEAEVVTSPTPSSTTRRTLLRRRGTTTTTTLAPSSTTLNNRRPFLRRTKATAPPDPEEPTEEPTTEDPDILEAERRDAYDAAKKVKAAEASRKEALASQKEAEAFEKEVIASKKEDEASKLEAEAFVREAAERNSTGTTSRPNRRGTNRFKSRKEAIALRKVSVASRKEAIESRNEAEASRKEVERNETSVDASLDTRIRGRRPSLIAGSRLTERPTRNFAQRPQSWGNEPSVAFSDPTEEPTTEDPDILEAERRDAYNAAKKVKAAEASRKEALASQKEAEAFEKEVIASKKEDEASKLEAEAFVREAAERNSTGTTSRPNRRGTNRFKSRKEAIALRKVAVASRKEAIESRKEAEALRKEVERNETSVDASLDTRIRGRRPSLIAGSRLTERPTRNFAQRRQSGGNVSTASIVSSSATRRPFRIASRRRLPSPTTTTTSTTTTEGSQPTTSQLTTSQPTTLMLESEELLQDIGDIDAIEDPSLEPRSAKLGSKTPRRPLVNLKDDQNASASNDEERRRQSKKYSSSFKQNQLEDILKKNDEVTTEAGTTFEDNAAAALALAAHQLITAPLPSTDDSKRYTEYTASEFTKTPAYAEYTTAYRTAPDDLGQTTVGETYSVYDTPRVTVDYTTDTARSGRPDYSTADYATKTTYDVPKTSLRSSDSTDIDTGKATFETFPSTVPREGYTNTPTDFSRSDVPKLSTLSRYPTTPAYQTVTNQYVPSTFDYTTIRGYTDTSDLRSYSTPRTIAPSGFSSPNVIPSGFTGIQRGGAKFENEKYATDVPTNTAKYTTIPVEDRSTRIRYSPASDASRSTVGYSGLSLSSPNVITSAYTGLQRGGAKYENDKFSTDSDVPTNTAKYTTIPVEDRSTPTRYTVSEISGSTVGYTGSSQEPAGFFTREYLLESPVTKTYDDEYQYLSPTTPQTSTRKVFRKKIQRRISTTLRPTTSTVLSARSTTPTYVPEITSPRSSSRSRVPTKKPFEKIAKVEPNRTYKPVINYDYYEDSQEKVALKYAEGTKVILHGKGSIECLDVGNFPHPSSCKKFISCARMEFGAFLGWEYVCPKGLSFDPVGGICNWSAGLGCDEKDEHE